MVEIPRDRKVKFYSMVIVFIVIQGGSRHEHPRANELVAVLHGLVKVYDQVIEHPCSSGFLEADLSRRNIEDAHQQVFPSMGCPCTVVMSLMSPPSTKHLCMCTSALHRSIYKYCLWYFQIFTFSTKTTTINSSL